jgi:hypothetical protein
MKADLVKILGAASQNLAIARGSVVGTRNELHNAREVLELAARAASRDDAASISAAFIQFERTLQRLDAIQNSLDSALARARDSVHLVVAKVEGNVAP